MVASCAIQNTLVHNPDDIFERVMDNLYNQGAREVIKAVVERQ